MPEQKPGARLFGISISGVTSCEFVVRRLARVTPLLAVGLLSAKDDGSIEIDQAKPNRSSRPSNMSRFAYRLGRIQSAQVDFLQDRRRPVGRNAMKLNPKFRAHRPFRDDAPEFVNRTRVRNMRARRRASR